MNFRRALLVTLLDRSLVFVYGVLLGMTVTVWVFVAALNEVVVS